MSRLTRRIVLSLLPFTLPLLSGCASHDLDPDELTAMGYVSMFDGKTLEGWRAVPEDSVDEWSVQDGLIVCKGKRDRLAYLVWRDEDVADFDMRFSYRMVTYGNTGVEVRSKVDTSGKRPFEGYHADLGHVGIGPGVLGAWDFHFAQREEYPCQRGKSLVVDPDGKWRLSDVEDPVTPADINERGWNHVHIVARGNYLYFTINGKMASEFRDNQPERLKSGMIGLQIHDAGMQVAFKDLWIKRL